jgi:hypothetical protein
MLSQRRAGRLAVLAERRRAAVAGGDEFGDDDISISYQGAGVTVESVVRAD